MKTLKENIEVNFHDFGLDKGFLDMTLKSQGTKEKIDKLDLIFFSSEDAIKKIKYQAIEWKIYL